MKACTRRVYFAAAALLGLGSVTGCYYVVDLVHPHAREDAQASAVDATPGSATSGSVVDALPSDTHSRTRTAYGPSWADADRSGCDQRDDFLARDLTAVTFTTANFGCNVATGHLADAYTGTSIDITRGRRRARPCRSTTSSRSAGRGSTPPPGPETGASNSRLTSTTSRPSTASPTRRHRTKARRRGYRRPPATTACTSPASRTS